MRSHPSRSPCPGAGHGRRRGGAAPTPPLTDNFSRNTGQWTVDKGSDALRTISRGRLIVSIPEEELFRWAALDTGQSYADFYVEVDAERLDGPEDGMMGIIFRYADADNFYAFLTSADGYYALVKYVDGELERLVDWSESDALDTGDGAENRLAVLAAGRDLVILANDEELDRVQDRSFADGEIALLAGTNTDAGLEAAFDNFSLWTSGSKCILWPEDDQALVHSRGSAGEHGRCRGGLRLAQRSRRARHELPGRRRAEARRLGGTIVGRSADSKWAKLGYADAKEAWASAQYLTFNIDFPGVDGCGGAARSRRAA